MTYLPYDLRTRLAARRIEDIMEQFCMAADADAGFDGGEFSGPANSRAEARAVIRICVNLRVLHETAEGIIMGHMNETDIESEYRATLAQIEEG